MLAKKIIACIACLTMVAMVAPSVGQAATAAELQAQITALQSQLQSLLGQLNGGTSTTTTTTTTGGGQVPAACVGITFTRNLTIGSTGTDVKCLQALLNGNPTFQVAFSGAGSPGLESTYFGTLTKNAVVKYQDTYASEILAPVSLTKGTGFVGASTRAKLNADLVSGSTSSTTNNGTTTTTGLPAGCTSTAGFSPVSGVSCSTGTTTTTTTTTTGGAEGTITVSTNPTPADNTKVYEGDSKVAVYGLKIKATGSDMDVQRVTLKFSSQPYSYFTNIYLYNGSTQLATAALNSTTVSKVSASDYEITLANFASKMVVPDNTTGVITVEIDALPGISSGVLTAGVASIVISTTSNGVRAVDQAGLNQYGGDATLTRTVSINESQAADATLTVSLDANTPKARNVVADSSENITGATLLTFDMQATKDNLLVDTLYAQFSTATSSTITNPQKPNTAYLYDDSGTAIGTASPTSAGLVTFSDLNYTVSKDTTKTFTIRIDDTVATPSSHVSNDDGQSYVVTVAAGTSTVGTTGVIFEKSNGTTSYSTGSAASNVAFAYAEGPIFTIASISTSSTAGGGSTQASSTISATFNVQVQAVTGDVYIPTATAFTVDYGTAGADSTNSVAAIYNQPSGTVLGAHAYKVGQGTSATFAVSATKAGVGNTYYDLRMESIKWGHTDIAYNTSGIVTSNYMANDSNWISQAVALP